MASPIAEASKDLFPTTEDKDVLFSAAAAGLLKCPVHSWERRFLDYFASKRAWRMAFCR